MKSTEVLSILQSHVPGTSVTYCYTLWQESSFELKITKSRQTKVGDFTSKRTRSHPRITLNNDLNPYLFLVTYVHEVAHLRVYLKYGARLDPHGDEWKNTFTDLMLPILWESVFPEEILHELRRHMIHPKASSFADTALTQAFRKFDQNQFHQIELSAVPEGSIFKLSNRYFKKGKLRRTRVLCKELKSKRDYLVPADALVTDVQLAML